MLLASVIFATCLLIVRESAVDVNRSDVILGSIITTLGIIIAVVTTYIFSRVFSERNERIERKKVIDFYSKKLTSLRRLSHKILVHTDIIWLNTHPDTIQEMFPGLSIFKYRAIDYNQLKEISEKTGYGEILIQGYLAARWLEGNNSDEYMLNPTFHKNYSLDEIAKYREASIFVYSYLQEEQSGIKLENLHEHWLSAIQEEVQKIRENSEKLSIRNLYLSFNDAYSNYLIKLYQLSQRNKRSVGTSFEGLFFDLILSSFVTGLSIYGLTFVISDAVKVELIKVALCGLVTILVDIIINTFRSTKMALIVDEFYE